MSFLSGRLANSYLAQISVICVDDPVPSDGGWVYVQPAETGNLFLGETARIAKKQNKTHPI